MGKWKYYSLFSFIQLWCFTSLNTMHKKKITVKCQKISEWMKELIKPINHAFLIHFQYFYVQECMSKSFSCFFIWKLSISIKSVLLYILQSANMYHRDINGESQKTTFLVWKRNLPPVTKIGMDHFHFFKKLSFRF